MCRELGAGHFHVFSTHETYQCSASPVSQAAWSLLVGMRPAGWGKLRRSIYTPHIYVSYPENGMRSEWMVAQPE
jgi:hypothetical protein